MSQMAFTALIVALTVWISLSAANLLLLSREVRDDFGYVIPQRSRQVREGLTRLIFKLIMATVVMFAIAYARRLPEL